MHCTLTVGVLIPSLHRKYTLLDICMYMYMYIHVHE